MPRAIPPLLAAAILSLAFAPAPLPKPDSGKEDLKRMQGRWVSLPRVLPDGEMVPGGLEVVFAGDRMTFCRGGSGIDWRISLDGTTRPKSLDMLATGPTADRSFVVRGRYALENGSLTICYSAIQALRALEGESCHVCRHGGEAYRRPADFSDRGACAIVLERPKR